jgi:hypothetical protein
LPERRLRARRSSIYHARLETGAEPQPDESKVAELHWAGVSVLSIGAQVSGDTVACWTRSTLVAIRLREGRRRLL